MHSEIVIRKSHRLIFLLGTLLLFGCESNAGTGAIVGTGVGMGVGALISPTPAGILIGGAVGAMTGAAIGATLDSNDRENLDHSSNKTLKKIDRGQQLSLADIEKMSEIGISDDKIIGTIHSTGSVYHLSVSDVENLKNAGVSQRVIDYMLQTAYS